MLGCALAVSVWMMWRMQLLQPIWALCAVGCLTVIVNRRDAVRALGVVAFLLMLIFPMGSDRPFRLDLWVTQHGRLVLQRRQYRKAAQDEPRRDTKGWLAALHTQREGASLGCL